MAIAKGTFEAANIDASPSGLYLLRRRRRWVFFHLGLLLVVGAGVLAMTQGSVAVPPQTILGVLLQKLLSLTVPATWPAAHEAIIWQIRLPRVLLAGVVGAVLALAGATYQGVFRNPLADPYLIGIASGAGLGATLALVLPIPVSFYRFGALPLMAFGGAMLAATAAYVLARVGRTVPVTTLILAGVAIASLASAATSFLMMASAQDLRVIFSWLLGGFTGSSWEKLAIVVPYLVPSVAVILIHGRLLNVLQLDEEQAQQLGINVERTKLLLIGATSLATALAVATSGLIGFVGLIVPHAIRLLWGPDYRFLLPMCLVTGALFLILADLLARTFLAPQELPVGVITAFCGAPFFLYLLRQRKRAIF